MATELLIGGSWRPASGGQFEAVDPATERVVELVGYASRGDVEEAVAIDTYTEVKGVWMHYGD